MACDNDHIAGVRYMRDKNPGYHYFLPCPALHFFTQVHPSLYTFKIPVILLKSVCFQYCFLGTC